MKKISNKTIIRQLDELAGFEPNGFPFTSLYLNAQANHHGRDNFEPFVRKELNERLKAFPAESPQRKSFLLDAKRINDYLANDLPASANGVAIFACSAADDLFRVIPFVAPVQQNELHVLDRPYLYPLARLIDQFPRFAALVADTDTARLFIFDLGKVMKRRELDNTGRELASDGVWSQLRFQRRVEKYNAVHAREVVDMLDQLVRAESVEHIVLGGDEVIIPLIRRELPAHLAEMVIDVLPLDIRTPEHAVLKAALDALRDDNVHSDAARVRDVLDRHRSGGLAVVGLRDTLQALAAGAVEELVLSAAPEEIAISEELARGASPLPVSGAAQGVAEHSLAAAGSLVTNAILTRAAIRFIEDRKLLSEVGGVGALLRYQV